ncbi:MAG: hypothetical protein WC055_15880 [Melioribacteraceae bacterium]
MTLKNILEMLYLDAYEAGLKKEDLVQTKFKLVELYLLKIKRNIIGE